MSMKDVQSGRSTVSLSKFAPKTILKDQWKKYAQACKRIDAQKANDKEIKEIEKTFSENKISAIKCNFTLDEEVQNFT